MLINDLDVRLIHATTGEIIRTLTIDPTRCYHGTGAPSAAPDDATAHENDNGPNLTQVRPYPMSRDITSARSERVELPTF